MKVSFSLPIVACISIVASAPAVELKGTAAALKRLAEQKPATAKPKDPGSVFIAKLEAFKRDAAAIPSAEGAAGWIRLADEFLALPQNARRTNDYEQFSFERLVSALPDPGAWPAIREAFDSRTYGQQPALKESLQLFTSTLLGDGPGQDRAIKAIEAALPRSTREELRYVLDEISERRSTLSGQRPAELEKFEKRLRAEEFTGREGLIVPDLVSLAGERWASEILERLLTRKFVPIEHIEGKATQRLAAKLGLELTDHLKGPPWAFVSSPEDTRLYETLRAKFKEWNARSSDLNAPAKRGADIAYLTGLIAQSRTDEAAKFAITEIDANELKYLTGKYRTTELPPQAMLTFLQAVLEKQPSLALWEELITVGARAGESAKALQFLRMIEARKDLSAATRRELTEQLSTALFAADKIEDGVKALRGRIAAGTQPAASDLVRDAGKAGPQLAKIGQLMQRPEWIETGTSALRTSVDQLGETPIDNYSFGQLSRDLVQLLEAQGKLDEAEEVIVKELLVASRPPAPNSFPDDSRARYVLVDLAAFYGRNDRHQDVLELLTSAEGWGVEDIADLLKGSGIGGESIAIDAANSLSALGRQDDAKRVIEAYLKRDRGSDRAYELRLKIGGDDLLPYIDQLAALDRFQERPLIWKAKVLFDAGKVDEAEKTIRAAIAIDPSDGEQGKGNRMRAYSVLGDILEKKGDAETAKIVRGAVRAIRVSESADDWWRAGLLSRAVKMYEEALVHFADAYCIESRLALRYADIGLMDLAEQHYQRAYELMPDSFGRIESHCFGCEGAFDGSRAQGIAERVFTKLAEKSPDKPQVHYLLGYLRESQDREAEAAEAFRNAVKLDPDYFNAWQRLASLSARGSLPQSDIDSAAFNLLRLDPLRGERQIFSELSDLQGAWRAAANAIKARPSIPDSVFPLPAAKAAIERRKQSTEANAGPFGLTRIRSTDSSWESPGDALVSNRYLQNIARLIERLSTTE